MKGVNQSWVLPEDRPNKRCSGLVKSARFASPISLAAELGVRSLQVKNIK